MKKLITIATATVFFLFFGFNLSAKTPDSTAKQKIQKRLESLSDTLTFSEIEREIHRINHENKDWNDNTGRWLFVIAVILTIFSLIIILNGIEVKNGKLIQPTRVFIWDGIIYAFWIIVPALWFLYEYVWIFDDMFKHRSEIQDQFKFTQELASKVWGAFVLLYGSILYLKYGYKK